MSDVHLCVKGLKQPVVHYDATRRRLWLLDQRCHHGATGALVTGSALAHLAAHHRKHDIIRDAAAVAFGGLLMAHDRKDWKIWFQPGHQNQP